MYPSVFLWLCLIGGGVVLLGFAMAYGMLRNSKRTAAEKVVTESATREEYRAEDS